MRIGEHQSTLALCTLDDQVMGRSPEVPKGCPDCCPMAGGEMGEPLESVAVRREKRAVKMWLLGRQASNVESQGVGA